MATILNGQLPAALLAAVPWDMAERLRPAALADLVRLNDAFRARFGHNLIINSSYRTLTAQQAYYANPPSGAGTAAKPGTSNHGWGLALDLQLTAAEYAWMRANAPRYGWVNPAWAHDGRGVEEPWHWENASADEVIPDVITPAPAPLTPLPLSEEDDDMRDAIDAQYRTSMARTPGHGEADPRVLRVARGQSTLVAELDEIARSLEATRYAVDRVYLEVLDRHVESVTMADQQWAGARGSTDALRVILRKARAVDEPGCVRAAYRALLDREVESAERVTYWATGRTVGQVWDGIAAAHAAGAT